MLFRQRLSFRHRLLFHQKFMWLHIIRLSKIVIKNRAPRCADGYHVRVWGDVDLLPDKRTLPLWVSFHWVFLLQVMLINASVMHAHDLQARCSALR